MLRTHSKLFRAARALGVATLAAVVAGCGGGGGDSGGSGGGSAGGVQPAANQAVVTVARGVEGVANIPTVSVTICAPGSSTCQTVDNIQVDTESFGLRLASSAASQVLSALPKETVAGAQLAECTGFADGFTWGSIRTADVTIGKETASSLPIQIVGDMPQSAALTGNSCSTGTLELTPADLGANGILGVGVAPTDCGKSCAPASAGYYACPNGANCAQTAVAEAQQVTNPVVKFAPDNNGVILSMPSIGPTGQSTVSGMLTFGINTQSNNGLPSTVLKLATNGSGDVNATFNGNALPAFFDSGSNAYFFTDNTLPNCSGNASSFYCPSSTVTRTVTVANYNGGSPGAPNGSALSMSVGNASALLANGNYALNNLAGSLGSSLSFVDLGMPFFYGKTVYYGMDQTASGGASPFVAF
ncbi:MAG: DUF3443 domain-containing protein [Paraburkholderia sp.]|nr:MAG: DUF3443 domain-containing protein [Paraburkholderia sp.]